MLAAAPDEVSSDRLELLEDADLHTSNREKANDNALLFQFFAHQ